MHMYATFIFLGRKAINLKVKQWSGARKEVERKTEERDHIVML